MLNKKLKDLVQADLVTVFDLSTLALIGNTPAQAANLEITDFTSFNDPDSIDGINNHGAIIGNTNTLLAFLYQGGNYTTFNVPNAEIGGTYPSAINDRGEIVGLYADANYNNYGFLYQGGNYTTLNDKSAITGGTNPIGINNHGEIVDDYTDVNGNIDGFLYQKGNYTTLNYSNAFWTAPSGINNHGEIVGYYYSVDSNNNVTTGGFIYQKGNYTALNDPSVSGFNSPQVNAINDRGEIAGFYYDANGNVDGFVYQGGTYTTVNYPGATSTEVYGINDRGEIVGFYENANGNISSGFTAEVKAVPEPRTIAATFVFGVGLITARLKLRRKQKASIAA